MELPLACHFRLAAEEGARIGLPEMDLGTVPAWGGSARLTRCVGRDHALDLILRAKKISGPEALRIGLVNEVWPLAELFDRAHALAEELAAMPALAVAGVLRAVVGAGEGTLEEGLAAERRAVLETGEFVVGGVQAVGPGRWSRTWWRTADWPRRSRTFSGCRQSS